LDVGDKISTWQLDHERLAGTRIGLDDVKPLRAIVANSQQELGLIFVRLMETENV
jgi:hypothetical protein